MINQLQNTEYQSTADRTMIDLCDQVDYWKQQATKWKEMYEDEVKENNRHMTDRLNEAKTGVAKALMFALSVSEGEDGSLVIPAENRSQLAEVYAK